MTVAAYRDDLPACMAVADVVLCMGGYNTLVEAVALDKRIVAAPRQHPEQRLRTRLFAERGCLRVIARGEQNAGRIAQKIAAAALQAPPPPPAIIALDGARLSAAANASLLATRITPFG